MGEKLLVLKIGIQIKRTYQEKLKGNEVGEFIHTYKRTHIQTHTHTPIATKSKWHVPF